MIEDEMKVGISLALKDPVLQQGFEAICKNVTELEERVEKMKCCMNCKHFNIKEPRYCNIGVYNAYSCDKWEMTE